MTEEQKAARKEYFRRYRQTHREQIRAAQARFYQKKADELNRERRGSEADAQGKEQRD